MKEVVCCIDMGTSRIKAALFDEHGHMVSLAHSPVPASNQEDYSFDAEAHLSSALMLIRNLLERLPQSIHISAVTVTNQRASIVPVGSDGRALGYARSWQDTSSIHAMDRFAEIFDMGHFSNITGLPYSSLWSLSKVLQIKNENLELYGKASKFVLLHDFVLNHLGTIDFITDFSNASVSGFFDLKKSVWSDEILEVAGIELSRLPRLFQAGTRVGIVNKEISEATGLKAGTPLIVGGGDQQCAALGMGVIKPEDAGLCLGTVAVISCPVKYPVTNAAERFFCTTHVAPDCWIVEGIHNTFGSSVKWICEILHVITIEELENIARQSIPGASGVIFLPFLAGIGSPDFDSKVNGAFLGLTLARTRSDIARAVFEGIAFEMRRILDAMEHYSPVRQMIVSGGTGGQAMIYQILANLTGRRLFLSNVPETTLLGAAILAWMGVGRFHDVTEGIRVCAEKPTQTIEPSDNRYEQEYQMYCQLVETVRKHHSANCELFGGS